MSDERIVQEHAGWKHGQKVRLSDDPEFEDEMQDKGMSPGEEGTLHISEVGAPEYGNVRTAIYFIPEGSDEVLDEPKLEWIEAF